MEKRIQREQGKREKINGECTKSKVAVFLQKNTLILVMPVKIKAWRKKMAPRRSLRSGIWLGVCVPQLEVGSSVIYMIVEKAE